MILGPRWFTKSNGYAPFIWVVLSVSRSHDHRLLLCDRQSYLPTSPCHHTQITIHNKTKYFRLRQYDDWLFSECSLSALYVLSECLLNPIWVLVKWVWAKKMKIESFGKLGSNGWKNRWTVEWRLMFLELLSEPKKYWTKDSKILKIFIEAIYCLIWVCVVIRGLDDEKQVSADTDIWLTVIEILGPGPQWEVVASGALT